MSDVGPAAFQRSGTASPMLCSVTATSLSSRVRAWPPALTRPRPARRSSSASSARHVRSPATSRDRNSLSTLASKPGSSNSRPSAYFQVIRSRTASAACRSVRFSENCRTLAIISWPGGDPRSAPHPERVREPGIRVDLAQLIADPHRQVPLTGRRTRHPRRELGNIRPGPRLHRHDRTILRPSKRREEGQGDRRKDHELLARRCSGSASACRRINQQGLRGPQNRPFMALSPHPGHHQDHKSAKHESIVR